MGSLYKKSLRLLAVALALLVMLAGVGMVTAANAAQEIPTLTLVYGNLRFDYYDAPLSVPDFTVSEDFQKRKLNAPISERVKLIDSLVRGGSERKDAVLYCFPMLKSIVDDATRRVACDPTDADIRFYPDRRPMFEIKRSSPGYSVNETRVYDDIYFALARGLKRVALSVDILKPTITAETLAKYTKCRATFSTSYASSTPERKHNVALALSRINGTVLQDGETFSFNGIVGKRTEANGFKPAKIIVGGQYTEGIGGGVCQASTTVYNAALRAGLKITKVCRHSLVPTYVDPSFDAMVNGSWSDLCFENDTGGPVFIRTFSDSTNVKAEIYSSALPYKIECRSATLSVGEMPAPDEFIDAEHKYTEGMESGEKVKVTGGAPALKSEGYLIKTYPDGRTEETRIRSDEYQAAKGTVAVAP